MFDCEEIIGDKLKKHNPDYDPQRFEVIVYSPPKTVEEFMQLTQSIERALKEWMGSGLNCVPSCEFDPTEEPSIFGPIFVYRCHEPSA